MKNSDVCTTSNHLSFNCTWPGWLSLGAATALKEHCSESTLVVCAALCNLKKQIFVRYLLMCAGLIASKLKNRLSAFTQAFDVMSSASPSPAWLAGDPLMDDPRISQRV
jgi:hypothetical protein